MKKVTPIFCLPLLFLTPSSAYCWGADAHTAILDAALAQLPPHVRAGYDGKRRDLKRFLMEPDMRSAPVAEGSRHFLDLEKLDPAYLDGLRADLDRVYGEAGYPDEDARLVAGDFDAKWFRNSPPPWKSARIGPLLASLPPTITAMRASMNRMEVFCGTVVYQPYLMARALARARERSDKKAVICFTGYLAHYSGDLFVPLHLTANYKGQYSGNPSFNDRERGDVHCRFESGFIKSRLETITAELSAINREPDAVSIDEITPLCGKSAGESYKLAERITTADNNASKKADPRRDWNGYLQNVSPDFLPLAVGQMRLASRMLASLIVASYRQPMGAK